MQADPEGGSLRESGDKGSDRGQRAGWWAWRGIVSGVCVVCGREGGLVVAGGLEGCGVCLCVGGGRLVGGLQEKEGKGRENG